MELIIIIKKINENEGRYVKRLKKKATYLFAELKNKIKKM